MTDHRRTKLHRDDRRIDVEDSDRTCVLTKDEVEGVLKALAFVTLHFEVEDSRTGKSYIPHMRTAFDKIDCALIGKEEDDSCPPF